LAIQFQQSGSPENAVDAGREALINGLVIVHEKSSGSSSPSTPEESAWIALSDVDEADAHN